MGGDYFWDNWIRYKCPFAAAIWAFSNQLLIVSHETNQLLNVSRETLEGGNLMITITYKGETLKCSKIMARILYQALETAEPHSRPDLQKQDVAEIKKMLREELEK